MLSSGLACKNVISEHFYLAFPEFIQLFNIHCCIRGPILKPVSSPGLIINLQLPIYSRVLVFNIFNYKLYIGLLDVTTPPSNFEKLEKQFDFG